MSERLSYESSPKRSPVLVERSDGQIQVWGKTGETRTHPDTGRVYEYVQPQVEMVTAGGDVIEGKYVPQESLSLDRQAELAEELAATRHELGDIALAGAGVEAPIAAEEREKDPFDYLRNLLPPVTRPDKQPADFDHLYGTEEEYQKGLAALQLTKKEREQQKYYDSFVTAENKQASHEALAETLRVNPEVGRVLREAGIDATSTEAVDAIRENADVRYEIAKYFAQKIELAVIRDPQGFGDRVQDNNVNNLKQDGQTGQKMMSRDYVVSLALKMLGGEYSQRHNDNGIEYDESGRVILGQHRHATLRLLMGTSWQ